MYEYDVHDIRKGYRNDSSCHTLMQPMWNAVLFLNVRTIYRERVPICNNMTGKQCYVAGMVVVVKNTWGKVSETTHKYYYAPKVFT